ncbi:unnamed protein product [Clonostachys solani]|uniref:Homeobox domain-containing protein n=1 Tax=Clonostachys solani TaxID=160281 RepID=A0A9N9W115_9HYPO|nr:unnamed protein product [Clonostachys solani]
MDYSPSRHHHRYSNHQSHSSSSQSEMAMLAASPAPPAGFRQDYAWDAPRIPSQFTRSTQGSASVSLPSIRIFFPELQLPNGSSSRSNSQHQEPAPTFSSSADPSPSSAVTGPLASPGYVHSPVVHKRRRDSVDDEQERERARHVPRMYYSPDRSALRLHSPGRHHSVDAWSQSRKSSISHKDTVPPPMEVNERVEPRPSLPSLPSSLPSLDRNAASRTHTRDRYEDYPDHRRSGSLQHGLPPPLETVSHLGSSSYEYGPPRTSHIHPVSASPIHNSYDRTPFSAGGYRGSFSDYPRYTDLGHIAALSGDGKQRKRRGNLPKETTDKLRAWFMAHLSHPYPTEDEKQDLMRQTGLQMNQISNWFINARRRQLPTMINNARAETDAMTGRTGDNKILPTTERHDLDSGSYDEDIKVYQQQRTPNLKRGSV